MIHFKGVGEHSVFELEKIILEQQEKLHQMQIKIQKMTDWIPIEKELPKEVSGIIYNKYKYLVMYDDGYICTTLFRRSENKFIEYRSNMSKITHWKNIY